MGDQAQFPTALLLLQMQKLLSSTASTSKCGTCSSHGTLCLQLNPHHRHGDPVQLQTALLHLLLLLYLQMHNLLLSPTAHPIPASISDYSPPPPPPPQMSLPHPCPSHPRYRMTLYNEP
ncbi:unnamed protein product, partial [Closterium sp. NIES-53]